MAEVACWVVAVGGEEVFPRAPADPTHDVSAANLNHPHRTGWQLLAGVGVDDPKFHAIKRLSATAPCGLRHVGVGRVAAVRAERFGHPEKPRPRAGLGPVLGWQHTLPPARLQ